MANQTSTERLLSPARDFHIADVFDSARPSIKISRSAAPLAARAVGLWWAGPGGETALAAPRRCEYAAGAMGTARLNSMRALKA
ncbi:unnamed protein product, partial [Iphiclides podalirius]